MYYFLSFLAAALITIMVAINGQLTNISDLYVSSAIVHFVGLIGISFVLIIRKTSPFTKKGLSLLLYTGGIVGVATTLFNNAAFGHISMSAIIALSLLAQTATSLIIDQFGLFHMEVKKINKGKIFGIIFTVLGIVILLKGSAFALVPVILSLLTGISVVVSRFINADLTDETDVYVSTWFNYFTGLIACTIIWFVAVKTGQSEFRIPVTSNVFVYTGGIVSIFVVALSSVVTKKMPAFILTLIMFCGQMFTSVVLDFILGADISVTYILGGIIAFLGLCLNMYTERKDSL